MNRWRNPATELISAGKTEGYRNSSQKMNKIFGFAEGDAASALEANFSAMPAAGIAAAAFKKERLSITTPLYDPAASNASRPVSFPFAQAANGIVPENPSSRLSEDCGLKF
jgi:hypothetical protein